MMCVECGGELASGRTTKLASLRPLVYLVVEDVPALVCERGGEAYTDARATDVVLRLVQWMRDNLPAGARATLSYDYDDIRDLPKSA